MSGGKALAMAVAGAVLGLIGHGIAWGEILEANPQNYRELVGKLRPGDTLRLAAGEYKDQLRVQRLNGEPGKPIVISGPDRGAKDGSPAVFIASSEHNTADLKACSYLTLRNLKFDGRNQSGPMAVILSGGGHHIALENLTIVDYGAHQSLCAISCYDGNYYWDCVIRNCRIINVGTGMYLGQWQGKGGFVRGLIEGNLILDPVGYCAQLKPQTTRPDNVPEGQTVIRYNVFAKTRNGSGGAHVSGRDDQRPCLNINPYPASGRGSGDMYLVYGNLFYQNYMRDAQFQGAGNIALYDNLFINEMGNTDAVNIQTHVNGKIRKLWVFNNTVVCKGTGIHIGPTEDKDLHVFGNAVFAGKPLTLSANVKEHDNLTGTYGDAAIYLAAPFAKIGAFDPFPRVGRLTGPKDLDSSGVKNFKDWNRDFNAATREKVFYGAYADEGRNPGWRPELECRNLTPTTAPATDN